jgi:hypothetical protein
VKGCPATLRPAVDCELNQGVIASSGGSWRGLLLSMSPNSMFALMIVRADPCFRKPG